MANSFNELFGLGSHSNGKGFWPLQDDAASTSVLDYSPEGNDGTLIGGDNTADISGTGPNSWATKALVFDGLADGVDASIPKPASLPVTIHAWIKTTSALTSNVLTTENTAVYAGVQCGITGAGKAFWIIGDNTVGGVTGRRQKTGTTSVNDGNWHRITWIIRGSTDGDIIVDGSDDGGSYSGSGAGLVNASNSGAIGYGNGGTWSFAGSLANVAFDHSEWSSGDQSEIANGPEPVVISGSDTVSGTEQVGETLSASGATWGLDSPFSSGSNGTITYTYQWTRSDDASGTNEADISGATSSTYTLQAADLGKYIRRRVRASNDGGFDSSADHNSSFTGAIAALGGVVKTRPFTRSFQPAFQGAF